MVPLGRYADPAELGEIVYFLATDASSFITGETVNANGGMFTM
jgi:3-oxoacyl-[acyl-carrier protein] reductase